MPNLIHGELSYRVVGILYAVHSALGSGFQEKYYQRAIRQILEKEKIPYLEQVRTELIVYGVSIGRYYIDFIIENKIVLEIKAKNYFSQKDIKQVLGYLKKSGLELGILAAFTPDGLKFKRILRGRNS
ncbi:MAG: GxxExxY protein [Candidatus Saganbacteria bacterium]|nr:GxxExxY protein [Candidatus Saganbacteria bacterium]